MKTIIRTKVTTYFRDMTYRNNIVEQVIPNETAENIKRAWQSVDGEINFANAYCAKYLAKNQNASTLLVQIDDEGNETILAGMHGMNQVDTEDDEFCQYDEEDEDF